MVCVHDDMYSLSNIIMVDKKFTSFHQYLRYCHKSVTFVAHGQLSGPFSDWKKLKFGVSIPSNVPCFFE